MSEADVNNALKHKNVLGAGEKKRKHLSKSDYASAIMREMHRGTLHSGSGAIVKNKRQALAIIMNRRKK